MDKSTFENLIAYIPEMRARTKMQENFRKRILANTGKMIKFKYVGDNKKTIVITGRIPSKKNSRNIFVRNGKPISNPSKKYAEWHEQASWELLSQKPPKNIEHCEIEMKFYAPDNRAADLDNRATSVLDLLVDNGVIVDDSWFVVNRLTLIFMGKSDKPRVEINI